MNEAEWWEAQENPRVLLDAVSAEGPPAQRRLRLFAVAVARRAWPLLTDDALRLAVEVAEQFADGLAGRAELAAVLHDTDISDWMNGVGNVAYLVARLPPTFRQREAWQV